MKSLIVRLLVGVNIDNLTINNRILSLLKKKKNRHTQNKIKADIGDIVSKGDNCRLAALKISLYFIFAFFSRFERWSLAPVEIMKQTQ